MSFISLSFFSFTCWKLTSVLASGSTSASGCQKNKSQKLTQSEKHFTAWRLHLSVSNFLCPVTSCLFFFFFWGKNHTTFVFLGYRYCSSRENLTIDHVIPISRGGEWTWQNLVCDSYWNSIRVVNVISKYVDDWLKLFSSITSCNIGSCMFKMQLKERPEDGRRSTHEVTQGPKGIFSYFQWLN